MKANVKIANKSPEYDNMTSPKETHQRRQASNTDIPCNHMKMPAMEPLDGAPPAVAIMRIGLESRSA